MKKILLSLIFYLFSITIQGQNIPFSIQKSEVFKDEYRQSVFVLAEKLAKGGMMFARYYESGAISPGNGLYIEKYDENLKLIKDFELKIEHPNYKKHNIIVGVFSSENIIHVIEIFLI